MCARQLAFAIPLMKCAQNTVSLRSMAWTLGARTLQQLAELLQKRLIQTVIISQHDLAGPR